MSKEALPSKALTEMKTGSALRERKGRALYLSRSRRELRESQSINISVGTGKMRQRKTSEQKYFLGVVDNRVAEWLESRERHARRRLLRAQLAFLTLPPQPGSCVPIPEYPVLSFPSVTLAFKAQTQ